MNAPPTSSPTSPPAAILSDLQTWAPRRWWQAILSVWAAHVVLVWIFSQPPPMAPAPARPAKATLHFVADPETQLLLDQSLLVPDAALLPMPGLHGFSEGGWLRYAALPQPWSGWSDGHRWLDLDPQSLGSDFGQQIARGNLPPTSIAEKTDPPSTRQPLRVARLGLPTNSTVQVFGPLARDRRAMIRPPEIPSWPHFDALPNTVVQVLVDREGWVFSATLLVPCGSPQADGWALNQSRTFRFQPDPKAAPGPLNSEANTFTPGRLVFHWHTTSATNMVNSILKAL